MGGPVENFKLLMTGHFEHVLHEFFSIFSHILRAVAKRGGAVVDWRLGFWGRIFQAQDY